MKPHPPAPNAAPLDSQEAQARRFSRAREARHAEILEDYAELIDDLIREDGQARATEIARRLGVSHVTAVKAVARLEREGYAKSQPYRGVTLTEAGVALAARIRARHLLVVDLLLAVGVPVEDARADAEGIEHHVSPATLTAFAAFLARLRRQAGGAGPAPPDPPALFTSASRCPAIFSWRRQSIPPIARYLISR